MNRNQIIISVFLVVIFIIAATVSFFLYPSNNAGSIIADGKNPTLLGNTSYGNVIKMGPYGNKSSNIKIAYIIGVHPLESKAHQALFESLTKNKQLKYCYYIYKVNVTKNANDYNKGRMSGQLLANKYVVPDIINQKFNLAIDVHSNVGNWKENQFIFSPVNGSSSEEIGLKIKNKISWLTYYVPPNPTSTFYVTNPLIKAEIPAIVYETYFKNSVQKMSDQADEFVSTVDGLDY